MDDLKAEQQLQKMVESIADDIQYGMTYQEAELDHEETGCEPDDPISGFDYLQDCLDIQYIVSGAKEYLGARVLVAFGGPNVWINTQSMRVEGHWWSHQAHASIDGDGMGLDDALRELWECS